MAIAQSSSRQRAALRLLRRRLMGRHRIDPGCGPGLRALSRYRLGVAGSVRTRRLPVGAERHSAVRLPWLELLGVWQVWRRGL